MGGESDSPAEERALILENMCRIITHRGPDDQGTLLERELRWECAGFQLSIGRWSPSISNEDDSVTIVFNGEIYNFQELTPELQSRGLGLAPTLTPKRLSMLMKNTAPLRRAPARDVCLRDLGFTQAHAFIARDRVGKETAVLHHPPPAALSFSVRS